MDNGMVCFANTKEYQKLKVGAYNQDKWEIALYTDDDKCYEVGSTDEEPLNQEADSDQDEQSLDETS